MSTDLITQPASVPVAADVTNNLHLIARNPDEMRQAQQSLAAWFDAKARMCERDAMELEDARDIAASKAWKTEAVLKRHAALMRKRVDFYRKCQAAVEAGYCIVPNFDVDVFAIRTCRNPKRNSSDSKRTAGQQQQSEGPPAGAGDLVNPRPEVYETGREIQRTNYKGEPVKDSQGNQIYDPVFAAFDWSEEIDFPISVARPEIMSETARAMALQIFDEFGVQDGPSRKGDPLVVGRIIDPRSTTYNRRWVTFLLAWYVNTADL